MSQVNYQDFDLCIEGAEGGYTVRVLDSPAGQATAGFTLPFSDLEVENFVLRVGRTRGMRRLESPEMEAAKVFGGRLFDALFQGEVRGCFRASLDEARRQGTGLRLRLRLEAPELADLPWEYLYNVSLNNFLSLSVETPLVRYLDLPGRIEPLAVKPPLRVLVMISSPRDCPALDVEREWARLQEAVGDLERRNLLQLERLPAEASTLVGLQRHLRRGAYHIFHFVGHGAFDERAQDGVLLLADEEGHSRPVSGQYLGTLLHDERTLRLAILNACEGARTSRTDPFAGTAQSLVQQGIPAVIAMQFEISDEAAIALAHEFYAALADGYPVDAALAEARKALFARGNDVEWGKPVLYLRAPDGRIFDVERVSVEERQQDQVALLYGEAQAALAREDWATAVEKLGAVLDLDPAHGGAASALEQARRQERLAALYAEGRAHYEAGRLSEAQACFRQVRDLDSDYKGVDVLLAAVDRAMREKQQQAAAPPQPAAAGPPQPTAPGRKNWLAVGIPAALALVIVLACGIYLIVNGLPFQATPTPIAAVTATAIATDTATPTPEPGVPVLEVWSVFPTKVTQGEPVTIRWRVSNAERVTLQPFGTVDAAGEIEDIPYSSKTYTLVATNQGQRLERSQEVVVVPPPPGAPEIKSFTVEPSTMVQGQVETLLLTWETEGADTVTIEPGLGVVGLAGSRSVPAPAASTDYTLVASGPGGEVRAQVQVQVEAPPPPDLPDLVVEALDLETTTIVAGAEPWTWIEYQVRNAGQAATPGGPIYLRIWKNGVHASGYMVVDGPIQPGAVVPGEFAVGHSSDWPVGAYAVQVEVDYPGEIEESDETNNFSPSITFEVVPPEEEVTAERITFEALPDGTPINAALILVGDEFQEQGVRLEGAPEGSYCAEATRAAVRMAGSYSGIPFNFLTASRPDDVRACNTIPVAIYFDSPVRRVTLTFAGATATYVLTAYGFPGNLLGSVAQEAVLGAGPFEITYDAGSASIGHVTFGHQAAVTAIKEITYER